jgi:hypothetical protein
VDVVIYIVFIVLFVLLSLVLFINPFHFSQDVRNMLIPWATLALAFTTILSVLRADIRERRSRRIDRLADILEWIEDILRLTHTVEILDTELHKETGEEPTYLILEIRDEINNFKRQRESGDHIQILASRADRAIYVGVTSVLQAIDDLLKEDWVRHDLKEIRNTLRTHEARIYSLASPLKKNILKALEQS